jgi:branched-chain amino acid aminotransferase
MSSIPLQLWALSPEGARPCRVPPHAKAVHELYDELPLGVYSAFRTFDHDRFLALDAHFDRTDRCLALLGWPQRLDRARLSRALDDIARAFPARDAIVRIDVLARTINCGGASSHTLIGLAPFTPIHETWIRDGVGVLLTRTLERPRPLIKTAQFVLERRPYPLGKQDAFEHVIVDRDGFLREGTSSNFYGVSRGTLRTPGEGVLEGVTRKIVYELARSLEIAVDVSPMRESELASLDEACLTSSTRGVVPIVKVADVRIGDGVPGPSVRALREAYDEYAAREARRAVDV